MQPLGGHFPDEDLPALPPARVLDFLVHLQDERKLAPATLNQAVSGLRTLYRDHLGLDWDIWKKIHIKREEPLPHVLTTVATTGPARSAARSTNRSGRPNRRRGSCPCPTSWSPSPFPQNCAPFA